MIGCGMVVGMRTAIGDGYELDDDPARLDRAAVHAFLTGTYWAQGRSRAVNDELMDGAALVVGLYRQAGQVGYLRVVSDRHTVAYLADVYVLPKHRGAGLGRALVRFALEQSPLAHVPRWLLYTRDMQSMYRVFGFTEPHQRLMERRLQSPGFLG